MCYLWDRLEEAGPEQTIYSWERFKLNEDHDAHDPENSNETNHKIRQILMDYFDLPTSYLQEFLYGFEGKTYKQEEVNPIL